MKLFFLAITLIIVHSCYSQNSDCISARLLEDSVYIQEFAPKGSGTFRELVQPKKYDSTSFKIEKNSEWFMLNKNVQGKLSFTIVPMNINDDYDFMLFDATVPEFCDSVKIAGKIKALRSNISRNDKSIGSVTGLSATNDTAYVGIGVGNSFCKPLTMEAGKNYMLVICCDRNPQLGFTLKLQFDPLKNSATTDSLIARMEAESKKSRNKLQLYFADHDSKEMVLADAILRTEVVDTGFVIQGQANYSVPFKSPTDVMSVATGYMIEKRNYFLNEDSLSIIDTVFLKKIVPDTYLDIIPFYFEGNTDKLLPKSKPALTSLLMFLQKNPSVKIEIQGHANGPKRKNEKEFRRLSENRAEAIKKYLTFQGINKKRLLVEGFGNSMMLFPEPQNEEESELNRRVEIKIISID